MLCPVCGNDWTITLETRKRKTGAIVRRIECANLHRWNTIELPGVPEFIDQRKEPRRGGKHA